MGKKAVEGNWEFSGKVVIREVAGKRHGCKTSPAPEQIVCMVVRRCGDWGGVSLVPRRQSRELMLTGFGKTRV